MIHCTASALKGKFLVPVTSAEHGVKRHAAKLVKQKRGHFKLLAVLVREDHEPETSTLWRESHFGGADLYVDTNGDVHLVCFDATNPTKPRGIEKII